MTETTNTGETTIIEPFPCSTLPPPPKPADAGNALFFAGGNKPAQIEAAANGAKKGISEWESANSGQLP